MTFEDKIFMYKRFDASAAERFGFVNTDGGFVYEADFANGDFHAVVTVRDGGAVTGRVFDKLNDEEYLQLRSESYGGAYVNSVRAAYEELLLKIADGCFTDIPFASEQANRIAALIFDRYSVKPDFPWGTEAYRDAGTFRHADSGKWFALIMNVRRGVLTKDGDDTPVDVMNLKVDPVKAQDVLKIPGVYPAYHMNHKQWISVMLDGTIADGGVMELVGMSFDLTSNKKRNAK